MIVKVKSGRRKSSTSFKSHRNEPPAYICEGMHRRKPKIGKRGKLADVSLRSCSSTWFADRRFSQVEPEQLNWCLSRRHTGMTGGMLLILWNFYVEDSIVTRSPKHLIVSGAVFPATHNSNDDNKSTRKKPLLKMRFLRSAYIRSTYSSEAADKQRHIEVCQHVLVESKQL
jgi:hypothetical protein